MFAGRLMAGGAGLVAALAIAACGGGNDNSGNTDITPAQAEVLGGAVASELGNLAASLTQFSSPGLGGLAGGFFAPSAPGSRVLFSRLGRLDPRVKASLASLFRAGECLPTETDDTDTDGDGIPDDDTATFTAANCTTIDSTGGNIVTTTVTGTVRIQDTDDANTIFGYTVGIAGFTVSLTDTVSSTPDVSVSVTGDFNGDVQTNLANAGQNLRTTLRINGSKAVVEHSTFAVNYDPTSGTIALGDPTLPPGELTVNGSYSWDGSYLGADGSWSFALQTPDPLVFDGCEDDQFVFESGQMRGVITARRSVGFTADYSGCGVAPVVSVFSNTAVR